MKMFKNLRKLIVESLHKGEKPSSSRIFSYAMMGIILVSGLTAISIELVNAIIVWKSGNAYTIPNAHIVILGMWLAHQLTLLGIYKRSEGVVIPKDLNKVEENIPTPKIEENIPTPDEKS
jgi:hypothetical protein